MLLARLGGSQGHVVATTPIPRGSAGRVLCRASASPTNGAGDLRRHSSLYVYLGLSSTATAAEVRAAYRTSARRLHPDTNPSPTALADFQRLKAAYEVLSDVALRRLYDNGGLGSLGQRYSGLAALLEAQDLPGGPAGARSSPGAAEPTDTTTANGSARRGGKGGAGGMGLGGDSADTPGARGGRAHRGASGGGGRMRSAAAPAPPRGRDVHTVLGMLLSEAAQGVDKAVAYEALCACEDCQGRGELGAACSCQVCAGSGRVLRSEALGFGEVTASWEPVRLPRTVGPGTCPACAGSGVLKRPVCPRCRGRGRRRGSRELAVAVPAGVESGQLLRLRGEGHAGRRGAPSGDLIVQLMVYPDPNLARVGDLDLHSHLAVDVWVALLGGRVAVNTLGGARLLDVPPGAQPGDVLCMAGAGVARAVAPVSPAAAAPGQQPGPGAGALVRGDHYFTLSVNLPHGDSLCGPSQELLKQLARIDNTLPRKGVRAERAKSSRRGARTGEEGREGGAAMA